MHHQKINQINKRRHNMSEKEKREVLATFAAMPDELKKGIAIGVELGKTLAAEEEAQADAETAGGA
jgi:hypothetical protein